MTPRAAESVFHARECRRLVLVIGVTEECEALLDMADPWDDLAEEYRQTDNRPQLLCAMDES